MTFPFYLDLFGLRLHPHLVLESLGYFVGARVYFALRRRTPEAPLPLETNLWLLVGAAFGAWTGSKLLAWAESPQHYFALAADDPAALLGGKTIVGGLLGGWAGVELAKKICRVVRSTGDAFVWPLALGTAIGRVGCFLTGLSDRTYGFATSLPWGVDFGDGIRRHPTQLYESLFVLTLATALTIVMRRRAVPIGARFRLYFAGYFLFRFTIEFLKPRETAFLDLSAIQLASLLGAFLAILTLRHLSASDPIENRQ
jgi:phosphatidylglycerol:prolipoprotein diacylglycerol transferase